jgi:polysaccharide export outer membrane protein
LNLGFRQDALMRLRSGSTVREIAAALGVAGLAAALSACSSVPSTGPSRDAVFDAGGRVDAPFALVEINETIINALAHWPGPSFFGRFGDYRAAVEQRIGIGDSVTVTVYEAATGGLFSNPSTSPTSPGARTAVIPEQVVARDGSITVPYAGRVSVVGKTPPEVETAIVERLTGKAIEPQAIVTLTKSLSSSVTLNGEMSMGSRVPLSTRGDRLLDVIATGGGTHVPVEETFLELSRGNRTARVPMQALLADPRENIFARPGDTLTVIRYPVTFTAVGATMKSAVVPFQASGVSLAEAVAKAGGLVDERADPEGVFVLRYEAAGLAREYPLPAAFRNQPLVPVAYHINMRDPGSLLIARRFQMHDKDILYVANSPVSDLAKVLGVVNLVASPLYSAAYLGTAIK